MVVVASVSAIYGLGDPDLYLKMMLHLTQAHHRSINDPFCAGWRSCSIPATIRPSSATFRVRGEVIDIYPAESDELALRVGLFDDEVKRLSLFDPLTGQIEQVVPRFTIYPKSHYVTPRERIVQAMEDQGRSGGPPHCWPTTSCWKSSA